MGLIRAGAKYIMGSNDSIKGTSTISQQLIRNTILTNERSIKRKIQEMYLSYRLNSAYSKEKYLKCISMHFHLVIMPMGSRSFSYIFWKSAKMSALSVRLSLHHFQNDQRIIRPIFIVIDSWENSKSIQKMILQIVK